MSVLRYPKNLENEKLNPAVIQFDFFERQSPKNSAPAETIQLYMPKSASQPSTVQWSPESLGFLGFTAVSAFKDIGANYRNGTMSAEAFMAAAQDRIGAGMEVGGARAAAGLGSAGLGLLGGSVSAETLMGAAAGVVPNPYLTMIFKGVSFRSFAFSFNFVPFEPSDCDIIDDIIKTFRKNALPEGSGETMQYQPMLKYPKECEIKYMWRDEKGSRVNKYLHKFKRSVCTGIDVDYTGQGMFAVMRTGMPACITLNTKWTEIEIVLRQDVENGY